METKTDVVAALAKASAIVVLPVSVVDVAAVTVAHFAIYVFSFDSSLHRFQKLRPHR